MKDKTTLEGLIGLQRARRITRKFSNNSSRDFIMTIEHANSLSDMEILSVNGVGKMCLQAIRWAFKKPKINNNKYNSPCLEKADANEPIFVLRGQDISSPPTILRWMADNFESLPEEKLQDAFETVMQMKNWERRKKPD